MKLVLIAHNVRSAHNVGSLLRTADGLGFDRIYLTGYTPYPQQTTGDERLPHLAARTGRQIAKTSLGAEQTVAWEHYAEIQPLIEHLKDHGFTVAALEQAPNSVSLPEYRAPQQLALIVGREVEGIESEVLRLCDAILEIPMLGQKESFNVAQAAAMALYQFRFGAN